jgi:hypothetical protein
VEPRLTVPEVDPLAVAAPAGLGEVVPGECSRSKCGNGDYGEEAV